MRYAIVLAVLFVGACDKKIIDQYHEPKVVEQTVSCTYAGFCFSCDLSFDGDMECSDKFSPGCSGNQRAEVRITPYTWHYESKPDELFAGEEAVIIRRLDSCK